MLRSLPAFVNEHQGFLGDNGEKSSGFGGEHDVDHTMIEDITSRESNDEGDKNDFDADAVYADADADAVSDRERFTCGRPIVDPTKIQPQIGVDGLVRLNESDRFHEIVKNRFVSAMEALGVNAQVEHICRNLFSASAITHARLQTFLIYSEAVKDKTGGHANIRHAWFGASKDDIKKIISHGFSHDNIEKDGAFGYGLYLCTDNSPYESVKSSTVDDEGMRHILLCRVLLGKVEAVKSGCKQCHPSSDEFQTGVDNLVFPRKLIVWSTQLNTHILPEFVISFKTLPGSNGPRIERVQFDAPVSHLMSIKTLISGLSKILPPEATKKIDEYHSKYIDHKISRHDMLLGFRELAGDRLLLTVVKDFNEQQQLKLSKVMDSQAC